jgi:CRISPR-associated protein Cas2
MLVLVTYDVSTVTDLGRRRLRKVAKICENHGQRVQNSVFECVLDASQLAIMKHKLTKEIDEENDSLRFYVLGNNYKRKVEHIGSKPSFDAEGVLIV